MFYGAEYLLISKTSQLLHIRCVIYFIFRYIDEVSLVMHAKSAAEIEDSVLSHLGPDRLVSWHSFDDNSLIDRAEIPLPALAGSISYVTGRISQAINFSSIGSYYQV